MPPNLPSTNPNHYTGVPCFRGPLQNCGCPILFSFQPPTKRGNFQLHKEDKPHLCLAASPNHLSKGCGCFEGPGVCKMGQDEPGSYVQEPPPIWGADSGPCDDHKKRAVEWQSAPRVFRRGLPGQRVPGSSGAHASAGRRPSPPTRQALTFGAGGHG